MKPNAISDNCLLEDKVNFFKQILNQIPDLIFQLTISSSDEFNITYLNKNILSYFELNEFDLNANPIDIINDKIHPMDRDVFFVSLH